MDDVAQLFRIARAEFSVLRSDTYSTVQSPGR